MRRMRLSTCHGIPAWTALAACVMPDYAGERLGPLEVPRATRVLLMP